MNKKKKGKMDGNNRNNTRSIRYIMEYINITNSIRNICNSNWNNSILGVEKIERIKKFIIFIASIGLIAIMIAIYFLFINDESTSTKKCSRKRQCIYKRIRKQKSIRNRPNRKKNENNKYILYFHGGAYMGGLENYHWNFIEKLSKETGYGIIIPDYPLAPKYTYKDVFEMIEPLYTDMIKRNTTTKPNNDGRLSRRRTSISIRRKN